MNTQKVAEEIARMLDRHGDAVFRDDEIKSILDRHLEWMVVVPREPTEAMLSDGHEALTDNHKTGNHGECPGLYWGDSEVCYKAMLAAAEKP